MSHLEKYTEKYVRGELGNLISPDLVDLVNNHSETLPNLFRLGFAEGVGQLDGSVIDVNLVGLDSNTTTRLTTAFTGIYDLGAKIGRDLLEIDREKNHHSNEEVEETTRNINGYVTTYFGGKTPFERSVDIMNQLGGMKTVWENADN